MRESADLTQKKLAEAAGMNFKYLSEIERGTKGATIDTITSIANALGVSPADLLPGSKIDEDCFQIAKWIQEHGNITFHEIIKKVMKR